MTDLTALRRNTIIRPVDDIDVLAVFDDTQVWGGMANDSKKLLYRFATPSMATRRT